MPLICHGKPTIGLEYFMATGDSHPGNGDYHTFDQLYATPHYSYGYMDLMGLAEYA
ncbi:MAG: hypothetical protein KCCBMMGE_01130 [Candidatus Methanoperedenaceae archaeon GB37]|nr:MAG: hypothetical protein KCCBMMGE_01130 [Candidatus Methanoperedenaceae archaeon GB37]